MEWLALVMFGALVALLLFGYPVAFTLGAVALLFGIPALGVEFFNLLPLRIWGVMTNYTLLAVPLFVFMGVMLEKSGIAEDLLETMGLLFGGMRGGLTISIVAVGALLAATTGIVGATVVTMAVIALPAMLKHGYEPELSTGTIAAAGTLGQLIPPSVVLVLLGDAVGVPVGRLFAGALLPGLLLVGLFVVYVAAYTALRPAAGPPIDPARLRAPAHGLGRRVLLSLIPPAGLVLAVLGSIFFGVASPTESAALGALGATLLAAGHRRLTATNLTETMRSTMRLTSMVFVILVGATAFGLVFRGLGGDALVHRLMSGLPGEAWGFLAVSMTLVFVLGFFLDFLEILFIVVPVLAPIAQHLGVDPLWFAVLLAVNLQTSFLTPPFGFSLFYLKAAAPGEIRMSQIYRGVLPFVGLQLVTLLALLVFPALARWLPDLVDRLQGL
ncbi:C4-dicarboxylate ABC transporter [Sulfurifustis variabilis]|uniref:TRAP transporter large permease protein n=1 Tax=Sulfurifustis variabilis TaxID=1675686 RepID=A0A1B4VA01_9GAMM|nr:TRAP transporter large permease subunit [Sulfurifustis variabilis]BAU50409.1 C4-dicarboxylate ABC transporter [Sulfurifustis variabilis]